MMCGWKNGNSLGGWARVGLEENGVALGVPKKGNNTEKHTIISYIFNLVLITKSQSFIKTKDWYKFI